MIPSTLNTYAEWPLNLAPPNIEVRLYSHSVAEDPYGLDGGSHEHLSTTSSRPTNHEPTNNAFGQPDNQLMTPQLAAHLDALDGQAHDTTHSWSQDDIDRILMNLQESLPDVGRLFDGSIGQF
jgi:hypothetical protein